VGHGRGWDGRGRGGEAIGGRGLRWSGRSRLLERLFKSGAFRRSHFQTTSLAFEGVWGLVA
jgi:hypothetical protein